MATFEFNKHVALRKEGAFSGQSWDSVHWCIRKEADSADTLPCGTAGWLYVPYRKPSPSLVGICCDTNYDKINNTPYLSLLFLLPDCLPGFALLD